MTSFAERIIDFYINLNFKGELPAGISIMNPFRENPAVISVMKSFYRKYYSDNRPRHMILGINPGRFGAGVTGIPFTDTVRLREKCGLIIEGVKTYEISSVFIYEIIDKYGGPEKFYEDFYISSISPLGFTKAGPNSKELNFNYYDSGDLAEAIIDFATDTINRQIEFGIIRNVCFCLGSGKNYRFLQKLNSQYHFFEKIIPLEHPRFIMQYRLRQKETYIRSYIRELSICKT
jgi:hypothetical protein